MAGNIVVVPTGEGGREREREGGREGETNGGRERGKEDGWMGRWKEGVLMCQLCIINPRVHAPES